MPFLLVQYPTGHKAKVEAPPNKPLIKALEAACCRRSLNPDEYIFTHNDHPVDLSLPFRLSGLVNNACVDLVARASSGSSTTAEAAAAADVTVRMGFRLDNGERIVWTGNPHRSLWDILNEVASGHEKLAEDIATPRHPSTGSLVIIYLQEQVIGKENLQTTTPMDLGIFQGSALVQLSRTLAPEGKPGTKPVVRSPIPVIAPTRETPSNLVDSNRLPQAPNQPDPDEPMPSPPTYGLAQTEFTSPFSVFAERPTHSMFGQPERAPTSSTTSFAHTEKPRSLGELLGISLEPSATGPGPTRIFEPANPFANFQFPSETVGLDLLGQSLDENEVTSMPKPVDRQAVLFRRPTVVASDGANSMDFPAEMFEHTEEDIRRLLQSYRDEWRSDQPLTTAEMRRAARLRLYAKYPRAVIQFHWPDEVVLQACFDPRERVSSLYEFVRTHLRDSKMDFRLFTTPPKVILKDIRATLIDADVVPLAKVYFASTGSGNAQDVLLADVLAGASTETWSQAQEIVSFWMDRARTNGSHNEATFMNTAASAAASTNDGPSVPSKWVRLGN